MIIEYEGRRCEFEFDDITVKQAMKIERHTGLKLTEWGDALAAEQGMNLLALQALGWLVLSGGEGAVEDTDFKLAKLGAAFAAAMTAAGEQAADAPVPTVAVPASNGQTPDLAGVTGLSSATG